MPSASACGRDPGIMHCCVLVRCMYFDMMMMMLMMCVLPGPISRVQRLGASSLNCLCRLACTQRVDQQAHHGEGPRQRAGQRRPPQRGGRVQRPVQHLCPDWQGSLHGELTLAAPRFCRVGGISSLVTGP
eukprot:354267-Chlamydomonas_euryale.AAC.5